MLRSLLLWASTNPFLAERLPTYGFVRRAVRRFMPGEAPEDALEAARRLEDKGIPSLITQLGENVETAEEVRVVVDDYLALIADIRARGLDAEVSIKPTHLGIDVDAATTARHLVELARAAAPALVWIDMESSAYVDPTLELYRRARTEVENVGVCLQAYLRRTKDDLEALMELEPHIRLVKGAYLEPPDVAFPKKGEVDGNFRRLASTLLRERKAGRTGRPAIATHDPRLIGDAQRVAYELELAAEAWEVEMLYGISTQEQERLVRVDTPLRVLISYGTHWFPWYMRRLAERPANLGFVMKQMVKRG